MSPVKPDDRFQERKEPIMKKVFALLVSLALVLAIGSALAEAVEINWSDFETEVAEAGWVGDFIEIPGMSAKMYMPSVLQPVELTDEDVENGYIGYYATEDQSAAVALTYVAAEGLELAAYKEALPEYGASEIEDVIINGIAAIDYKDEANDAVVMAMATEGGAILSFIFAPASDESFAAVAAVMMASVQSAE